MVDGLRVIHELVDDPANKSVAFFIKVVLGTNVEHNRDQSCQKGEGRVHTAQGDVDHHKEDHCRFRLNAPHYLQVSVVVVVYKMLGVLHAEQVELVVKVVPQLLQIKESRVELRNFSFGLFNLRLSQILHLLL